MTGSDVPDRDFFTLPGTLRSKVIPSNFKKRSPIVWAEDETIYVAFNLAFKPVIPPYIFSHARPTNSELRRLNWVRDGYIYFAFLPNPLEYRGPLLSRLRIEGQRPPIVCSDALNTASFKLEPKLTESWTRLAGGLEQVVNILLPFTGFSTNIKLPPRPKCFNLLHPVDSRENCVKLIFEIRDAFSPWMALVSFCIAVLDGWADIHMKSGFAENHPVWIGKLLASNIHPGWIGWLVDSPLSWFGSITRLGTIIHFERNPYALAIGLMSEHNVPVVYCLNEKNDDLPPVAFRDKYLSLYRRIFGRSASEKEMVDFLRKYVPPPSAVKRSGRSANDHVLGGNDDSSAAVSTPDPLDPELDPQSGQKPFETREHFFARRENENFDLISRETPEESYRREKRLEISKKFKPPKGKSTTRVFAWEVVSNREIRCAQSSFMFEMLFTSLYTKEEMKYDAVRDEWDMWRNMKLSASLSDDDDYDPWLDEDFLQSDDPDPRIFEIDLCEALWNTRLVDNPTPEPGPTSHIHTAEARSVAKKLPLNSVLKSWYGYKVQGPTKASTHEIAVDFAVKATYESLDKENRLNAVLVDSISELPNPPSTIRLFLTHLIAGSPEAPKDLSDLSDRSLLDTRRSGIRFLPSKFTAQAFDDDKSPKLPLFGIELVDERGNRIDDRDGRQLFFWHATTVVAILRLSRDRARSISHVAKYLLELGAAFLMTIPRSRMRNSFQDVRVTGLGRRWRGYKPDRGDFGMYQQKCCELFSIRRIRRALRCGGILWRIALEFIGADEGLDGPVYEACNEPLLVCNSQTGRAEYVEDGLSLEEILLLIGSFELCDEKSNNKPVWSSYWPPPWIWESSGYCVGYWTPDCEDWFVNRLTKMKDGTNTDPLMCVEEWKGVLKRFRQTKKMTNTLEKHCIDFLGGVMAAN